MSILEAAKKKGSEVIEQLGEWADDEAYFREHMQEFYDEQWHETASRDPHDLRYAVDENHLVLSPTLATIFGMEKAFIIQQVHYFTCINRERKEHKRYLIKGRYYMYCSPALWRKNFPFISASTIKRKLKELDDDHILIRVVSHKGEFPLTFYALNYDALTDAINGFAPEENTFRQKNAHLILRRVRYDRESSVIVPDPLKL